eukprot:scaffold1340_cov253-Pinguiococcus_pyrenoidosus.AAC.1
MEVHDGDDRLAKRHRLSIAPHGRLVADDSTRVRIVLQKSTNDSESLSPDSRIPEYAAVWLAREPKYHWLKD